MNVLFSVLAFISLLLWILCNLFFYVNLKNKPIFRGSDCSDEEMIYPSLSVIIPACNEEGSIRQAVSQLLDQDYPDFEVIAVNDRSTDHTGVILEELKLKYPQLKVVTITDVPPHWLGKNHAVYQGVKQAKGEWLLLTDADVMYSPGSLKKAVSYSLENKLDHLTISPDITYKGFFFGGFISLFLFSCTSFYLSSKSAGIGAFNLIKRSTYQEIGGYEAIAMQPIDDASLGKLVVKKGYKQNFGFSKGLISVKLFDNLFAMIKGIEKNQFAGCNYSVTITLVSCGLLLLLAYPYVGLFFGPGWARGLSGFAMIIVFAVYNFSKKYIGISLKHALIQPISVLLYLWAVLNSMIKILRRGGLEWRGTVYSLEELIKQSL